MTCMYEYSSLERPGRAGHVPCVPHSCIFPLYKQYELAGITLYTFTLLGPSLPPIWGGSDAHIYESDLEARCPLL